MEKLKNSLLLTIVVMFVSTLVCAQNNIEKASIKKDTIKMFMELNEITVTPQKKEEKLQASLINGTHQSSNTGSMVGGVMMISCLECM